VALVLDTGVLYAALDEEDPDHDACASILTEGDEQLVIPSPVLVELDYWVRKFASADAWLAFAEDVEAGAYAVYPLDPSALVAAARIEAKYADLPLGLVDASVLVVCELLGEEKVATLDHRHFGVLRTESGRALRLLP
jgi:predicted nucleic acid-binding protein